MLLKCILFLELVEFEMDRCQFNVIIEIRDVGRYRPDTVHRLTN